MNLALPAFVILLGILPGICCFYGYFSGRFNRRTAGVSGVEELALYLIFAIPIDATALAVYRRFGIVFDFAVAARLLSGNVSDSSAAEIAATFPGSFGLSAWTYFLVLSASYMCGVLLRRLVWACRIDTVLPVLRPRHAWFYALQGRINGMPRRVFSYVDVLTEHPEGSRLYRGLVFDFEISSSGAIDSLTLKDARRGRGRGTEFKWVDVPSDRLTIMGSVIHSINVTYVGIDDRPIGRWPRIRHAARAYYRSFLHEEP